MFIPLMTKYAAVVLTATTLAISVQAREVSVTGTIDDAEGVLSTLTPVGTEFVGDFEFNTNLESGQVLLGGFCFTTDATGLPPASPTCPNLRTAVPIFQRGETVYTGNAPPAGAIYDQIGTTFDGKEGILNMLAFSPSFNINIAIAVTLDKEGGGVMNADAGILGTASGTFTWNAPDPPVIVPVPPAMWLFASAMMCLFIISKRRQKFMPA